METQGTYHTKSIFKTQNELGGFTLTGFNTSYKDTAIKTVGCGVRLGRIKENPEVDPHLQIEPIDFFFFLNQGIRLCNVKRKVFRTSNARTVD
jgi:hypothetical protein